MTDDVKLLNFVNSSDFLAYGAILPVECDRSRAGFKKYSTPYIYIHIYDLERYNAGESSFDRAFDNRARSCTWNGV